MYSYFSWRRKPKPTYDKVEGDFPSCIEQYRIMPMSNINGYTIILSEKLCNNIPDAERPIIPILQAISSVCREIFSSLC
jgi:hypothetical protein